MTGSVLSVRGLNKRYGKRTVVKDVSLDIANPLAQGTITSPSHGVQLVKHQNGVTAKLQNKAWLDRDFVLTIHGLKDMTFAMASADANTPLPV